MTDLRVTPSVLEEASRRLVTVSTDAAGMRDAFNDICRVVSSSLSGVDGYASEAFNEMFSVWWRTLDAMAQTTASVADATQQAAVIYDHVDRTIIPAPPAPPAPRPRPRAFNPFLPPEIV